MKFYTGIMKSDLCSSILVQDHSGQKFVKKNVQQLSEAVYDSNTNKDKNIYHYTSK